MGSLSSVACREVFSFSDAVLGSVLFLMGDQEWVVQAEWSGPGGGVI